MVKHRDNDAYSLEQQQYNDTTARYINDTTERYITLDYYLNKKVFPFLAVRAGGECEMKKKCKSEWKKGKWNKRIKECECVMIKENI